MERTKSPGAPQEANRRIAQLSIKDPQLENVLQNYESRHQSFVLVDIPWSPKTIDRWLVPFAEARPIAVQRIAQNVLNSLLDPVPKAIRPGAAGDILPEDSASSWQRLPRLARDRSSSTMPWWLNWGEKSNENRLCWSYEVVWPSDTSARGTATLTLQRFDICQSQDDGGDMLDTILPVLPGHLVCLAPGWRIVARNQDVILLQWLRLTTQDALSATLHTRALWRRDGIEDPFDLGPILHKYLSNEETNANGVNCPSERYKMIIRQALEALELLFQQTLLLSRLESSESDDTNLGRCRHCRIHIWATWADCESNECGTWRLCPLCVVEGHGCPCGKMQILKSTFHDERSIAQIIKTHQLTTLKETHQSIVRCPPEVTLDIGDDDQPKKMNLALQFHSVAAQYLLCLRKAGFRNIGGTSRGSCFRCPGDNRYNCMTMLAKALCFKCLWEFDAIHPLIPVTIAFSLDIPIEAEPKYGRDKDKHEPFRKFLAATGPLIHTKRKPDYVSTWKNRPPLSVVSNSSFRYGDKWSESEEQQRDVEMEEAVVREHSSQLTSEILSATDASGPVWAIDRDRAGSSEEHRTLLDQLEAATEIWLKTEQELMSADSLIRVLEKRREMVAVLSGNATNGDSIEDD